MLCKFTILLIVQDNCKFAKHDLLLCLASPLQKVVDTISATLMLHSPINTYVTICRKLSLQAWWSSRMLISSCLQIDKIMEPRNSMYNIFLKYTKEMNHKSKRIYHFDWNIEDDPSYVGSPQSKMCGCQDTRTPAAYMIFLQSNKASACLK